MSNTQTYLVKLTPVSKFFFGDENYMRKRQSSDEEGMFYFQRSRLYPQQTTLLGMVRYQLLVQNGLLNADGKIVDPKEAPQWIGEKGFDATEQTYGYIHKLSPVFVMQKHNLPLFAHTALVIGKNQYELPHPEPLSGSVKVSLGGGTPPGEALYKVRNYDPKKGTDTVYSSLPDLTAGTTTGITGLYQIDEPVVGIYKPRTANDRNEQGFYKMQYVRFNSTKESTSQETGFGFYVTLDTKARFDNALVQMGKERSAFRMEVKKVDWPAALAQTVGEEVFSNKSVLLLSDAYVNSDIYTNCSYAVSDIVSFRNMQTSVHTQNHFARPVKGASTGVGLGSRINLLSRGSLLYLKKELTPQQQKDCLKLLNASIYQTIGYNYFIGIQ